MKAQWGRAMLAFDEDGDDHRWERVCIYRQGDPYKPRPPHGVKNDSVVRGVQTDSLGDRTEWDEDFSGRGKLYIGAWDHRIHLYGAENGVWLVDDGSYFGLGGAPRASSPKIAPNVGEVVLYKDTNDDGFIDLITYDYDGDKAVDCSISLLDYNNLPEPELIDPAALEWKGLHELFKQGAKKSWRDAQQCYRAAWLAGLTDEELDELAIAASTWEQYNHGYWLKETLFRRLAQQFKSDDDYVKRLKRAHFSGDTHGFCELIREAGGRNK
jgi:hypothetical protein